MKWKGKLVSAILAVLLTVTMLPAAVMADESASTSDATTDSSVKEENGMHVSKTATLNEDGTYNINLEAYATGEATVTTEVQPVDIVLLLDVSGSMGDPIGGYTALPSSEYSYNSYNNKTYYYFDNDGSYYQVYEDYYYSWWKGCYYLYYYKKGKPYYLDGTTVTDSRPTNYTSADSTIWEGVLYSETTKMQALQTAVGTFIDQIAEQNAKMTDESKQSRVSVVKFAGEESEKVGNDTYNEGYYRYNYTQIVSKLITVTDDNKESLKNIVNNFTAAGATSADYGMDCASKALNEAYTGRPKVVVMFTDGEPNHYNGFDSTVANDTIEKAAQLKSNNTTIYTVAVLNGADPSADPTNGNTSDVNKYLHAVSSNYPAATSYTNLGTGNYKAGYYLAATSADELNNIFKQISKAVGGTTVELGGDSVMKDIISPQFSLPEGTTASSIEASIVDYNTDTHEWNTTGTVVADNNIIIDGRTVSVTGFSYKDHFFTAGYKEGKLTPDQDVQVNRKDRQAQKLVVTIKGVEADASAITGDTVSTNGAASGIYANSDATEATILFPQPQITFNSKAYVVDYAKPLTLDYSTLLKTVDHIDDPTIDSTTGKNMLKGIAVDIFNFDSTKVAKYGNVKFTKPITTDNYKITYTPTTTKWDGYDNLFVKGKSITNNSLDTWARISVIPANNVYYEDDFTTDSTTGTVGIEYTGTWNTDGTSGNNIEDGSTSSIQGGWEKTNDTDDTLADDNGYSNGSAHVSTTKSSTASFSFTGTGVDIFSRSNMSAGTVYAVLKKSNGDNASTNVQRLIVDNYGHDQTGYYGVPTLSFNDLEYGTYTVKLTVTTSTTNSKYPTARTMYYLDGIRIYNPMNNATDDTIKKAYGEDEQNAVFKEVRPLLADGTLAYIDQDENGQHQIEASYSTTPTGELCPTNAVFIGAGHSIAFTPSLTGANYYVALAAPSGQSTKVKLTNGEKATEYVINSATPLYYKVTAGTNNVIQIENTGSNLLSVTKVKITGVSNTSDAANIAAFSPIDSASVLNYAAKFDTLQVVDDQSLVEEDSSDENIEENQNATDTTDQETEELDPSDIIIDNGIDDTNKTDDTDTTSQWINNWFVNLFRGFRSVFGW